MNYSQKELIRLMKEGAMPEETGAPKHIETVISNVFIFDTKVYKFYKNDSKFFNSSFRDISGKAERFSFTRRDFEWNNSLSPSIYTGIIGVCVEGGAIRVYAPDKSAEELVIVMNRVNTNDVLFEKIMQGSLTEEDSFSIGKQLAQSLKKVQRELPGMRTYYQVFESRIKDLRDWIKSVVVHISEEESEKYLTFLNLFREKNRERFENELSGGVTTDGDFHSHNAIFSDGSLYLMDTFPPKEEWLIGHQLIPIYRIGTDIWALSGKKELFDSFIRGYEEESGIVFDRTLDPVHVIYASSIALPYLYMLQENDATKKEAAKRYHAFIRKYFDEIKKD